MFDAPHAPHAPHAAVPAAHFLHPSNLLTYASLLAGLAAVAAARELEGGSGGAAAAGVLLALAVLGDTFDGRFARRFSRSAVMRSFGVQLDSLSDAVTFGLVPAVVLYLLGAPESAGAKLAWWAAAFGYVLCVITRLGAYNVTQEGAAGFVGVPTPVSALVVSSALLAHPGPLASGLLLAACAAAMVSAVRIPRPRRAGLAAFAAWAVGLVVAHLVQGLR